jgi:large subunit ribosomal protein L16
MLMPKKVKYRKVQKGRMRGLSKGAREIAFGQYGLKAIEPAWLSAQQIEAVRVTMSRKLKKIGKLYIRVFPDKPITKKPAETRMGKGKGNVEQWVAVVKRERIMFEIAGLDESAAKEVFKLASYKLPMKTKFVKRTSPLKINENLINESSNHVVEES